MLPVAQDHGHGGHGCAQLVGRAGGQQAQAHDVFFLAGALAHIGDALVAAARVLYDAGQKDDGQDAGQRKTDKHAHDVEAGQAFLTDELHMQGLVKQGQAHDTDKGGRHHAPGVMSGQQHGTQNALQQIQIDKGVTGTAAQVQLNGQGQHIGQQRIEDAARGHGAVQALAPVDIGQVGGHQGH